MTNNTATKPLGWVKFWTPKDDWYYLSSDDRQKYFDDYEKVVSQALEKGAVLIGTYKCRGQSPWLRFEVWEFPEISILIEFSNSLEDIGHFQYFEEDNTVGRKYVRSRDPNSWVV
jgi:hypothetical protein